LADGLRNLSDDDSGFGTIKSGATNVLTSLGGLATGCGGGGNVSTSSSANQSKIAVGYVSIVR
jgi:hypothetical protein